MHADEMTPLVWLGAGLLDEVVGDPEGWPHPVRALGWIIAWADHVRRPVASPWALRLLGILLAMVLPAAYALFAWAAARFGGWPAVVVLGAWMLSGRSLRRAVGAVLAAEDLASMRQAVGRIVGRDTAHLDEEDVHRAALETLGESLCDGVVAPLFWFALLGLPGLWAFKAVSTLDSMVGHREAPWTHFGWASARLDDLANWIPARLTALLVAMAAPSCSALRMAWRDARKHDSPNAGWGEAALAGALGVRLGGENRYDGVSRTTPFLGEAHVPLGNAALRRGLAVAARVNLLALGLGSLMLWSFRDRP